MERKKNEANNEGFLTFHTKQINKENRLTFIARVFLSSLLFIIFMTNLQALFSWNSLSIFVYIPGTLLICLLILLSNKKRKIVISIYLFSSVVLLVIMHSLLLNGVFISVNQLFNIIGYKTGNYFVPYEVNIAESSYQLATTVLFSYIGLVIAYISYLIIKQQTIILLWLLFIIIFALQSSLDMKGLFIVNIIAIFLGLLLSITATYKRTEIVGSARKSIFTVVLISFTALFISISLVNFIFNPLDEQKTNEVNANIQSKTKQQINDFRYEKEQTNTFTEGNFTQLGELILEEETALEVIMENPTSIYLRGYVGSVYTSEKWLGIEPDINYENGDLFYWLNEEAFHPLNQLSTVNELMDNEDLLNETTVTVHNVRANSNYLYAPYELITKMDDFNDIKRSFHETIVSKQLFGERVYQFNTYENLVSRYPTLANYLYDTTKDEAKDSYKNYEQHYNQFVYDTYTEIPEETAMMLDFYLDKEEDRESHMAYETAISTVKDFLSRRLTYQSNPEPLRKDSDFLTHVLEDSKEGYATHYATAATVMFRYLDIPARYVEGYLVTPIDIKGKEAFEKISIEGTNAHAWTEIYIDQLGWIPIETTPPYENMMEPIDTSNYPKGIEDERDDQDIEEETQQSSGSKKVKEEEDKDVIDKKDKEEETNWDTYLIYIGIAIILLLLLALVFYFTKRRLKLNKIKQSFYDTDKHTAITNMFSYSLLLLSFDGMQQSRESFFDYEAEILDKYGADYTEQFIEAVKLNQVAVYSTHDVSEEEREYMLSYLAATVENVVISKGFFQRMKLRFWHFVY